VSALYASCNGIQAVSVAFTIGWLGTWCADVMLPAAGPLPTAGGAVALSVATLAMVGTVFRQDAFAGQQRARIVGGFGGWQKLLTARCYDMPGGVSLAMLLNDAALEVGEQVSGAPSGTVGVRFERQGAPATRLLRQLVGRQWWMSSAGVTQFGARPTSPVKTPGLVEDYDGGLGKAIISTEDPASWLPGAMFGTGTPFQSDLIDQALTVSSMSLAMPADGRMRLTVLTRAA